MAEKKLSIIFCVFLVYLQLIRSEKGIESEDFNGNNIEDALNEDLTPAFAPGTYIQSTGVPLPPAVSKERTVQEQKPNAQIEDQELDSTDTPDSLEDLDPPSFADSKDALSEDFTPAFAPGTYVPSTGVVLPSARTNEGRVQEQEPDDQVEEKELDSTDTPDPVHPDKKKPPDKETEESNSGQGYLSQVLSSLAGPLFESEDEQDFLADESNKPDKADPGEQPGIDAATDESGSPKESSEHLKEEINEPDTRSELSGQKTVHEGTDVQDSENDNQEQRASGAVERDNNNKKSLEDELPIVEETFAKDQGSKEKTGKGEIDEGVNSEGREEEEEDDVRSYSDEGESHTLNRLSDEEVEHLRVKGKGVPKEQHSKQHQNDKKKDEKVIEDGDQLLKDEEEKTEGQDLEKLRGNDIDADEQENAEGQEEKQSLEMESSSVEEEEKRVRDEEDRRTRIENLKKERKRMEDQERLLAEEKRKRKAEAELKETERIEEEKKQRAIRDSLEKEKMRAEIEQRKKDAKEAKRIRMEEEKKRKFENYKREKRRMEEQERLLEEEKKRDAELKERKQKIEDDRKRREHEDSLEKERRKVEEGKRLQQAEKRKRDLEAEKRRREEKDMNRRTESLEQERKQGDKQEKGREERNGDAEVGKRTAELEREEKVQAKDELLGNDVEEEEIKMKGEIDTRRAEAEELRKRLEILNKERQNFEKMAEEYQMGKETRQQKKQQKQRKEEVVPREVVPEDAGTSKNSEGPKKGTLEEPNGHTEEEQHTKTNNMEPTKNDSIMPETSHQHPAVSSQVKDTDEKSTDSDSVKDSNIEAKHSEEDEDVVGNRAAHISPDKSSCPKGSCSVKPDLASLASRFKQVEKTMSKVKLGETQIDDSGKNASEANNTLGAYAAFMRSFREFHSTSAKALLSYWPTVRNTTSDVLGYIGLDAIFDQLCNDLADVHPAVLFSTFLFGTLGVLYFLWSIMIGMMGSRAQGPNPRDVLNSYEARTRILEEENQALEADKRRLQVDTNEATKEKLVVVDELQRTTEKLEETVKKVKKCEDDKRNLLAAVEELRGTMQKKVAENTNKDKEIKRCEDKISKLENTVENQEGQIKKLSEDLQLKTEEKETETQHVGELDEKLEQAESDKTKLEQLLGESREKNATLQGEFDEQLLRLNELQQQYEFKCNEVEVLQDCLKQVKGVHSDDGEEKEEDAEEMQKRLQDLMDVAKVTTDLRKLEEVHKEMKEELEDLSTKKTELDEDIKNTKEALETAKSKAEEATMSHREKEIELDALRKYFKSTEEDLHQKLSSADAARISSEYEMRSQKERAVTAVEETDKYRQLYLDLKSQLELHFKKDNHELHEAEREAHENFMDLQETKRQRDTLADENDMLRKKLFEIESYNELMRRSRPSSSASSKQNHVDGRPDSPARGSPNPGQPLHESPVPFAFQHLMSPNPPPPINAMYNARPMPHPAEILGMQMPGGPATRGYASPPPTTAPQPPKGDSRSVQDARDGPSRSTPPLGHHQGPPPPLGPPHQGAPQQGPPRQGPASQGPPPHGPNRQGPPPPGPPPQGANRQGPPPPLGPSPQGANRQGPPPPLGPSPQGANRQGPPSQGPPPQGYGYGMPGYDPRSGRQPQQQPYPPMYPVRPGGPPPPPQPLGPRPQASSTPYRS